MVQFLSAFNKNISACGGITGTTGISQDVSQEFEKIEFTVVESATTKMDTDLDEFTLIAKAKGVYSVTYSVSFEGSNNAEYTISLFENNIELTNFGIVKKLLANTSGSSSFTTLLKINKSNFIDMRVKTDGDNNSFLVKKHQFIACRVL